MKKQSGITLIESIVTIVIISIISYAIYPLINIGIKSFKKSVTVINFTQESRAFFLYFEKLLSSNIQLIAVTPTSLQCLKNGQTITIGLSNYPGPGPYQITYKANTNPERLLLNHIGTKTNNQIGFNLSYKTKNLEPTTTPNLIQIIGIELVLYDNENRFPFYKSIGIEHANTLL